MVLSVRSVLTALAALFFISYPVTAAQITVEDKTHEHNFVEESTTSPTCAIKGTVVYRCTICSESYMEDLPALGHKRVNDTIAYPTCTEDGAYNLVCTVCNTITNTIVIRSSGHKMVVEEVKPTCRLNGTYKEYCTKCDYVKSSGYYVKLGHDYVLKSSKDADCTNDGYKIYECSRCDGGYTEVLEATGHDYQLKATKLATCTADGYYTYVCSTCKDAYNDPIKATGHSYKLVGTQAATCTEDGHDAYVCSTCKGNYSETLKATGHVYQLKTTKPATCTADGYKTYVCSSCKDAYNDPIKATGHNYKLVGSKAVTCTEDGHDDYVCSGCKDSYSEIFKATGHDYQLKATKAATCTVDGYKTYVCSTCKDAYNDPIKAIGHNYKLVGTQAATCTEDGHNAYVCSSCKGNYNEKIAATGHTYQLKSTKLATCTADGLKSYTCSVCKDSYADTLKAKGHNYELVIEKAATCTVDGLKSYTCSACEDSYADTLKAKGHDYELVVEKAATCTVDGWSSYTCSACEDSYKKIVKSTGHTFEKTSSTAPTCTKSGSNIYDCFFCDITKVEPVEALGHDFILKIALDPTCEEAGLLTYECSNCLEPLEEEVPAEGHDYVTRTIPPSFCCDGGDVSECTKCPSVLTLNPTEQLRSASLVKKVQINEVMPCNISTIYNEQNYNFSGYVEFYNSTDGNLSLKGAILEHWRANSKGVINYENPKWRWEIDEDIILPAKAYTLVWMDETPKEDYKINHSPYKLDADGGELVLIAGGSSLDNISYGKMDAHVSYGKWGENYSLGYMEPTPGKENKDGVQHIERNRCGRPTFSVTPGIMEEVVSVSLTTSTSGAAIYYTLDDTQPSAENGLLYMEPIEVKENTNIRAIACKKDYLPSKITTGSYIFMDDKHNKCGGFTVPVVSVTMDEKYYSDNMLGMFVVGTNGIAGEKDCQSTVANYNRDWKRPANFEYIVDGKQVVSREVETAIEGGCSRGEKIKSYSLKTSKKTGYTEYDYAFFDCWENANYSTLHLRNGGTAYSCVPFRDGLMQTFTHGMNIDYQGSMPVAYYRNGKYIRLMSLNERMNADYVKTHYGFEDDEIDLISLGDQKGIEASKGTREAYDELVKYLTDNNPNNPGYYEGACERMDMDEYIDYQIFQQFIVNTDWPGNNTKIWRAKEKGRFRWMLYDTDFGFGLCTYDWLSDSSTDMIKWCQGGSRWANNKPWMVEIFKSLSMNKEFEKKFTTRYLINLSDRFSEKNIEKVFDYYIDLVSGEYCAFNGSGKTAEEETNGMRKFALERTKNVLSHLSSYVKGNGSVDLTISSSEPGAVFTLNGENISSAYKGKYIAGYGLDIEVYPPSGYQFEGWEFSDKSAVKITEGGTAVSAFMPGRFSGELSKSVTMKAIFKKSDVELPSLVINEICASSNANSGNEDDYDSYPDWIELYNYGTEDVNLSGFRMSNSMSGKETHFPFDATLLVKAGEHKLLWAKGDNTLGPNYLSFKLSNAQGISCSLCLSVPDGDSYKTVDCISYMGHETNFSYGRKVDGGDEMTIFGICDDNLAYAATPGASNGSVCEHYTVETENVEFQSELALYPNPASDLLHLATEEQILSYKISDMSGRVFRLDVGNEKSISVADLSAGFYMIEVRTEGDIYRLKFLKE